MLYQIHVLYSLTDNSNLDIHGEEIGRAASTVFVR